MKYLMTVLLSLAIIFGCSKEKVETKDPHATGGKPEMPVENPNVTVKVEGRVMSFSNVKMTIPDNWVQETTTSEMRKVQFFLKQDDMIGIAGFYFGNQTGQDDANIDRWKNEFVKIDKSERLSLVNGKAIMVSIKGNYKKKPFPMATEFKEAPNHMMLACIVNTKDGPFYFKMVGEASILSDEVTKFKEFLNSYKAD